MRIFVTGGAGFIGSNFILQVLSKKSVLDVKKLINFDKLSYAGNLDNLSSIKHDTRYCFVEGDICDQELVSSLFEDYDITHVVNFAAESHVDRSIEGPEAFIRTNVIGTLRLLQAFKELCAKEKADNTQRKFLHVSTDEVYGTLCANDPAFSETNPYLPNSPYAASKAASDHLVRSYFHTFGLPVVTTNCSNNYGPYQFPEKLIPLMILNALEGKDLPIYGDGKNVRDWLHVEDHCQAIATVLLDGKEGETYNIGGNSEMTNLEVVDTICTSLDKLKPKDSGSYLDQKTFVKDRPGHDRRYAINATKIEKDLGWIPRWNFANGIKNTIEWYLAHQDWCQKISNQTYNRKRLGLVEQKVDNA
ncbi:MAG: dTDP-glucose 4,6-dehydratase [Verrucomicrobiota bacterium]